MGLYEIMCVKILKTVKHYIIERNLHSIKKKIKKKKKTRCLFYNPGLFSQASGDHSFEMQLSRKLVPLSPKMYKSVGALLQCCTLLQVFNLPLCMRI